MEFFKKIFRKRAEKEPLKKSDDGSRKTEIFAHESSLAVVQKNEESEIQIERRLLNEGQYIKEKTAKTQIVLHHTAGGDDINGLIRWWNSTPERIGTHYAIDRKGKIYQLVEDDYWIYHIGLKSSDVTWVDGAKNPINLEKNSIGIELLAWGPLTFKNGKFYSYVNKEVPAETAIELKTPFRKKKYFQDYEKEQVQSCAKLISFLMKKHKIPTNDSISWEDKFMVTKDAIRGVPGIYYHCSYRLDKSDVFPSPTLIEELKKLK